MFKEEQILQHADVETNLDTLWGNDDIICKSHDLRNLMSGADSCLTLSFELVML